MMNSSHDHQHLHKVVNLPMSVPTITYVATVMFFGVVGNGMVLLVYGCKLKKHSNFRIFVLMLAAIDMTQSCIGMPGILVDMLRAVSFYSNMGCKLLRLISHLIVSASAMTHLLIGLERHRKICKPLQKQISTNAAKIILTGIVILSFIIAMPAFMFYGKVQFPAPELNVTVCFCTINKRFAVTPYPAIYESCLFTLLVSTVLALFLIYILIARRIWKAKRAVQPCHRRVNNDSTRGNETEASSQILGAVTDHLSEIRLGMSYRIGSVFHRKSKIRSTTSQTNTNASEETEDSKNVRKANIKIKEANNEINQDMKADTHIISDPKPTIKTVHSTNDAENDISEVFQTRNSDTSRNAPIGKHFNESKMNSKTVKRHSRKVTLVSFAITLVFIISYVPHFFVVIGSAVYGHREIHMTSAEEALVRIGSLSYLFNTAANPFIYYLMDNDFKTKCKQIICKCCAKQNI